MTDKIDEIKIYDNVRESLRKNFVDWITHLVNVKVYYSDKPEGKYLFTINVPLIEGYIVIVITLGDAFELLRGHIKL